MLVGYARISTQDQNLDLQRNALLQAGCQRLFEDKVSGSRTDLIGLNQALDFLRSDDTLVVWKLDRLVRSTRHLIDFVTVLDVQGIHFKSLTDSIDTSSPSGRFFFHIMASLSEMERDLMIERTHAGLLVARQLGHKSGRKRKMTDSKIESAKALLAIETSPSDIAKALGVSIPTLYRRIPASSLP